MSGLDEDAAEVTRAAPVMAAAAAPTGERMVRRPPRRKGREMLLVLGVLFAWTAGTVLVTAGQPLRALDTGDGTTGLVGPGLVRG